jgi:hypothetical protein
MGVEVALLSVAVRGHCRDPGKESLFCHTMRRMVSYSTPPASMAPVCSHQQIVAVRIRGSSPGAARWQANACAAHIAVART